MLEANAVTETADLTSLYATSGWIGFVFYVLVAIALWKVFTKAGYPGILAIIPIVNVFILVKVAGYSAWLGLLYLIPIVNLVFGIIVAFRVGKAFGKGGVFSFFLLWLFAFIGYFIIGFGQAQYTKPA
ncbi:MAG: DUF5684 domain-containing protein [Microbacterium sp.]